MGAQSSRPRLSQDDLEFLQNKTHYDKDTIIDFYDGFMSDCRDGKLSQDNFCDI